MKHGDMKRSVAFGRNPKWLIRRFYMRKTAQEYLDNVLKSLIDYDLVVADTWSRKDCILVTIGFNDYYFRPKQGYYTVNDNRFYYDFSHILRLSKSMMKDEVN